MSNQVTEVEAPAGTEDLLKEYALAEVALTQAKEAMRPLRAKLLALFPKDQVGDFSCTAGKWVADVKYPDKQTWDSDELAAYFGADLPAYVKRTFGIAADDFAKLSEEQRAALSGARVQGIGSPKISVEVVR